jgi:preprotein translocase subunit YajC
MKAMKRSLYIIGGCLVALLILFLGLDPNKIPSFMLVLPFILLFAFLFIGIALLLEKQGMERKKRLKIAGLCSALPILLLVLQSIGQLTVRDVLTVVLLFAVSYFYIARATASS